MATNEMQRTTHETEIVFAEVTQTDDGKFGVIVRHADIRENNPEKAVKALAKMLGRTPQIMETNSIDCIYYLPEEIFFKYARRVVTAKNGNPVETPDTPDTPNTPETPEA